MQLEEIGTEEITESIVHTNAIEFAEELRDKMKVYKYSLKHSLNTVKISFEDIEYKVSKSFLHKHNIKA